MSIFKYCPINEYTINNLKNNQLYFNIPKKFNDPYEGIFKFDIQDIDIKNKLLKLFYQDKYEELLESKLPIDDLIEHTRFECINQYLNDMGVCCMSCINDSILMWSHYADKHKGICIEYDNNDIIFKIGEKVKYSKGIPILKFHNYNDTSEYNVVKIFSDLTFTKYIEWSYEEEYRLFRYLGEKTINYNPKSIRAIYFGLKVSNIGINKIKSILSNKNNIKFYRVGLEKDLYKLRFIDI